MPSYTTRLQIPYSKTDNSEAPRGPDQEQAIALALDNAAIYGQGLLANRPVSTSGTPGIEGRVYYVIGDTAIRNGILWLDNGTGWDALTALRATSIANLNAMFGSGTPTDGARAKLYLSGSDQGENAHLLTVTYDANIGRWITDRVWEAVQTGGPVTVTGPEQTISQADFTQSWIENYKDIFAAGLNKPQLWLAAALSGSSGSQARLNAKICAIDSGDPDITSATVFAANTNAGIGLVSTTAQFSVGGWIDMTDVTTPTKRHGILFASLAADAGGSNTATMMIGVARVRLTG